MEKKIELQLNIVDECGSERRHAEEIFFEGNKNVRWQDVSQLVREKLSISQPLAFSYFDDEGDIIFGQTEQEWQEVKALSTNRNYDKGEATVDVNILVLGNSKPVHQESSKQDCCKTGCLPAPSCCDFSRPIPPELDISGPAPGVKVNPLLDQYKYSDEALRAVALPIGPIGGGSIALAGDGGLRQWQVSNRVAHTGHVPDSFFAVRVDQGDTSKAVILQSSSWYNQEGFTPAPYVTDHDVPKASIELLSELPGVKTLEVTAKYPIAEVDFLSDEVPVKVHLEIFNPCIPLDSKNSALPVLVINYSVTNYSSTDAAKVSLLGSLQNIAGWDGITPITSEVCCAGYGGNLNHLTQSSGLFGITMSNPSLEERAAMNGQVSISVVSKPGDSLTTMLQYDLVKEMWGYFTGPGLPGQGKPGPSPTGKTWNGAISCMREIQPKCSETFTFLLAWHFPHRYVNWSQKSFGINDPNTWFYLGNQYAKFWKDIGEVLAYTAENLDTLSTKTRLFRDSMFNSSLSWQLIDSAAGRVSVMRSPTCMWLADGNLYGFEGCKENFGCCPLNCTHVFNYEMAIAKCFPDLERTMRNVDLKEQISPNAIIPSRTTVPLELRRQWSFWPNYTDINPSSTQICVDGEIGTVLKTYREVLQGASEDWFNSVWPAVKKIMKRWMTELDNGDGLIAGPQPNTYDCDLYGVNTFTGGLYLTALRAAEEMAKLQKETDLAEEYAKRFALGSTNLDKACFTNGKWYTQVVDLKHPVFEVADGTWVDCLLGQWWAHALHLGYILPPEHVKSTLQNVHSMNHVDSFNPADQFPRKFFDQRDAGMFICRWPETPPKQPLRYTSEGAWSGLEYAFAGLCLYENLADIALSVLKETREKYDGTRRSPWNEIECGDHYVRPMAAFLLFEVASGQTCRLSKAGNGLLNLGFAPRLNRSNFCGFFITGTSWGQFKQRGDSKMSNGTAELCVHHGELLLSQMNLDSRASTVKASVAGDNCRPLVTTVCQKAEELEIHFGDPSCGLELKAGESLVINLSG